MKFTVGRLSQEKDSDASVYLVRDTLATNLTALDASIGSDLMGLIGRENLEQYVVELVEGADSVALDSITPAMPIKSPSAVMCLGLNYIDHIKEGGYEIPDYPALFMRGKNSLMPAQAPMIRPECSEQLDYEAELMVIIGQGGKHIPIDQALAHVFGYTIFNDGSIREYQRKTHQWTPGKNFDSTGPIGPIVVTPDELPPGASGLHIESRVGNEVLQSANTSEMLWPVDKTIATISEFATLSPGDMIAMGTPPGVGHARKPPRWIRPGETIEIEIEGIGVCSSPVVAEDSMREVAR